MITFLLCILQRKDILLSFGLCFGALAMRKRGEPGFSVASRFWCRKTYQRFLARRRIFSLACLHMESSRRKVRDFCQVSPLFAFQTMRSSPAIRSLGFSFEIHVFDDFCASDSGAGWQITSNTLFGASREASLQENFEWSFSSAFSELFFQTFAFYFVTSSHSICVSLAFILFNGDHAFSKCGFCFYCLAGIR